MRRNGTRSGVVLLGFYGTVYLVVSCGMPLSISTSASGQTVAEFQARADRFASDLAKDDTTAVRDYYLQNTTFNANLVPEDGKAASKFLQDRNLILAYWSSVRITAIKI